MRLELALDLGYRTEAVVEPAMSYELSDDANARMQTRAEIRTGVCRCQQGKTTQALDVVVFASVALPLHAYTRRDGNCCEEVLNLQPKALCPDIAQAFWVLCCKFRIEALRL